MESITVIKSKKYSKQIDKRYIVINKNTGEIVDDAQGYGYRSEKGALASFRYKQMNLERKNYD